MKTLISNISRYLLKTILLLILSLAFLGCSDDSNSKLSEYKLDVVESILHEPNLRIANFDKDSNQYLLAYSLDYDLIKFEVRDSDFNLVRSGQTEGNYFASPNTMVIMNNSLVFGNNIWNYYKSNENLLIQLRSDTNFSDNYVKILNSENTNANGIFYYQFDDSIKNIGETDNYLIITASKETCYFINKTDYQVTSFKNRFVENYNNNDVFGIANAIGNDDLGRPILSTSTEGVLVYNGSDWIPFWDGKLNKYSGIYSQFYLASNNYLYAGVDDEIFVFDLNLKKMILKITGTNNINFRYSRIIGEHSDGSIIILTNYLLSNPSNRIFKIKIAKN